MTYEEFKNKFPIGSNIKIIYGSCGEVFGEISLYSDHNSSVLIYWKTYNLFGSSDIAYWYNTSEALLSNIELVQNPGRLKRIGEIESWDPNSYNPPNKPICPRCSNEMVKKQSDQYGLIDKCSNCGYC